MDIEAKKDQLFQDRVRKLFENTISGVVATLVNSIILVFILDGVIARGRLLLWFLGLTLTSITRVVLKHFYKAKRTTQIHVRHWSNGLILTIFLSGSIWGSAGVFLFPAESIGHQVFIAFVLGGMVAGSVGIYSVITKAFVVFSIPMLFPIMANFFLMDIRIHYSMGTMLALFWVLMLIAAIRQEKEITNAFLLKYENIDLINGLETEIGERRKAEAKLVRQKKDIEKIVAHRTIELREVNVQLNAEIQERKAVFGALQRSEQKYRLLAENVTDIIWTLNLETMRFDYQSPSVQRIRGFTPEEAMELDMEKTLTAESLERVTLLMAEELAQDSDAGMDPNRSRTLEMQQSCKDGSYAWAEATVTFLRDDNGDPVGILGVSRDISERKKAERFYQAKIVAEASNRAKSEFLSTMSHELRTPLNHIIGFTELLLYHESGGLSKLQREYLEDVDRSSKHLLSLVNDILDLSKVEAGKTTLKISRVALQSLIESSTAMFREKTLKHGISLSVKIGDTAERVDADERKLKQIMYNLLSNAIKFTPAGGKVDVVVRPAIDPIADAPDISIGNKRKWIEICVADTGIGLQSKDFERIFYPFEQVDNSLSRDYQGTGLGLALTKKLVELHAGRLWVESEGEGQGCTFRLLIPTSTS